MKRGQHKSLDKELNLSVKWLESFECVTKVVLGLTENCRHKFPPGHLKIQMNKDGGMKLKGYSGNGVVDIFVKVDPIEKLESVKTLLRERFPN